MKSDWILLFATVTFTIVLTLSLISWLAPGLLGIPIDLQMVQVSKELPPFFEGIFRKEDYDSKDFILKDPYTSIRAKPLYPEIAGAGPHDILGFRNRHISNVADIVVIGDSQTYGNNATLEANWPSQLAKNLTLRPSSVYAMAVGGWGAVQYLDMFFNAAAFQPRVVIVAFYTGNDSLESFLLAYNSDRWKSLRSTSNLQPGDAPKSRFPAPQNEWWPVQFKDGTKTIFTPTLRYASNSDQPAIKAGYDVMIKVAETIDTISKDTNIKPIFTIIPTKELVYWPKVKKDKLEIHKEYIKLVEAEQKYITQLTKRFRSLDNSLYVDIIRTLQHTAMDSIPLYPQSTNGHPISFGYTVIGKVVAKAIGPLLPELPEGLFVHRITQDLLNVYVIRDGKAWLFPSPQSVRENGWQMEYILPITYRDLIGLPRGVVGSVDPVQFGPQELNMN
jgi:lysophospholipase L1-like esterase